ncbi:unnamed protein product [Periconia digitata]|uniref:Uncharacterized protein n=1 Tax=Periconia digitata TaxID=1303443 RepID=A0A9W4XR43_9PLEO|nr:unnamed protein product [Periconia digitata]
MLSSSFYPVWGMHRWSWAYMKWKGCARLDSTCTPQSTVNNSASLPQSLCLSKPRIITPGPSLQNHLPPFRIAETNILFRFSKREASSNLHFVDTWMWWTHVVDINKFAELDIHYIFPERETSRQFLVSILFPLSAHLFFIFGLAFCGTRNDVIAFVIRVM